MLDIRFSSHGSLGTWESKAELAGGVQDPEGREEGKHQTFRLQTLVSLNASIPLVECPGIRRPGKRHLQVQEQSILMTRKLGKNASRPAWINRELLEKLKHRSSREKVKARAWIERNTETLSECVGMRKDKAQLEFVQKCQRQVEGFLQGNKRESRGNVVGPLLSKMWQLATENREKPSSPQSLPARPSSRNPWFPETRGKR